MKKILVAIAVLTGGVVVKGVTVPFEVEPGEELTAKKAEKLGLDEKAIEGLIERGSVGLIDVREAEEDSDSAEELAAAVTRAEKAEGEVKTLTDKVAELEKDLAEATKPKAPAA